MLSEGSKCDLEKKYVITHPHYVASFTVMQGTIRLETEPVSLSTFRRDTFTYIFSSRLQFKIKI